MIAGAVTDPSILRKLIFRENNLREGYQEDDLRKLILDEYGENAIMELLPRGGAAQSRPNLRKPLHDIIEDENGNPFRHCEEIPCKSSP